MNTWNLKLKSRIAFILAPKREIGLNIIKYVQDLMKKLKELSRKIFHVHIKGDSILRCQFFPPWSIDSTWSQSKYQWVIL